MMFGKTPSSPKIDSAVAQAVSYEISIADLARRSERRAWMVAFVAIAIALILAGGYFYMLPLKERVPFLVMADAYTGNATVARLDENFRNRSVTASEAINRSNVAHYVTMRESFDDAMMHLRDWRAVHSMSSPQVGAAYSALHSSRNPDSPLKIYGRNKAVRARILSIVFIGGEAGTTPEGATVRFQRSLYDKATGASQPLDSKIATLEFTYNLNLKMDEKDRIENPLGFQVTSYRVDNDYAASPPLAEESPVNFDPPVQASAPQRIQGPPASAVDGSVSGAIAPGTLPPTSPAAPATATSDNANGAIR